MKRWLIIIGAVGLIGAGVAYLETRPLSLKTSHPSQGTVREYITEDGKTRLDDEYIVTMLINGRVLRIDLEEGDAVTSGQVVARVDDFDLRQQLVGLRSQIDEIELLIEGVDKAKPKDEDIEAARLKVEEAQLQIDNCTNRTEIGQINLDEAEREFKRMKKLLADGVIQRAQYDRAKRDHDATREQLETCRINEQAANRMLEIAKANHESLRRSVDDNEYQRGVFRAQIRQVESQIALAEDQLAKTRIFAPISGVVLEKYVEDEQVLVAGTPLLKIGDMDSIEIEADILSEEVGSVRKGQRVEITGKALGEATSEGRIKRIYPSGFKKISALGIEQQRVKVIIAFDNSELELRPYVSVDVKIIIEEHKDVLTLPEQAVFKGSDVWNVFVIEGGKLAQRAIEIGLRNDVAVEIIKGVTSDDVVVTEPTNDLEPGLRAVPAASP